MSTKKTAHFYQFEMAEIDEIMDRLAKHYFIVKESEEHELLRVRESVKCLFVAQLGENCDIIRGIQLNVPEKLGGGKGVYEFANKTIMVLRGLPYLIENKLIESKQAKYIFLFAMVDLLANLETIKKELIKYPSGFVESSRKSENVKKRNSASI
jgi:hypothetical protein